MPVDMHFHWVPTELSHVIRGRATAPKIVRDEAGVDWLDNGGKRLIRVPEGFDDDVDARVRIMDSVGISHGLLSLATIYRIKYL